MQTYLIAPGLSYRIKGALLTVTGIEVTSTITDGNITSRTTIHYSKSGAPYTTTLTAFVKMLAADGAEHIA